MKKTVIVAAIVLVAAVAAVPALGSAVSSDALWNQRDKQQQADTLAGTTSIPLYRPQSLIGHPQGRSVPGITGSTRHDPPCQCAMMDHAHR